MSRSYAARLARKLLRYFANKKVILQYGSPQFARAVSSRPLATQLTRAQAASGNAVTNAQHTSIMVTEIQRHLLVGCDGLRSIDDLVGYMSQKLLNGELALERRGHRVTEPEVMRRAAMDVVPVNLKRLAELALFVS